MVAAPGVGAGFAVMQGLSAVGAGGPWTRRGAGAQEAQVRQAAMVAASPAPPPYSRNRVRCPPSRAYPRTPERSAGPAESADR